MKKIFIGVALGIFFSISLTYAATRVFSDVSSASWYAGAVNYLASKGIVTGYKDGTFKPNKSVSRAEVAAMLDRVVGMIETKNWKTYDNTPTYFKFKYPESWLAKTISIREAVFTETSTSTEVARLSCPTPETGFEAWTFTEEKREEGSATMELWNGTPNTEAYSDDNSIEPLYLIFMYDTKQGMTASGSCMITMSGWNPENPTITRDIYKSIATPMENLWGERGM